MFVTEELVRSPSVRVAAQELLELPTPLPPKPPDEPEPLMPLPPEPELETPAEPREPAEVVPELRLAVLDELLGAELMLLPEDATATAPAAAADLLVAALTRALDSAPALLVAATPPPVPDA
jgi:hypothetical protein